MTQKQRILSDLKKCRSGITQKKAYEKYGVLRLAAVIHDLRDEGYDIKTDMIAVKNRFDDTCYVAKYTLEK